MDSINLLKANRFDIAAKHLYARYRESGYKTNFAEQVYKMHLFAWNNFNEIGDKNKNCYADFLKAFDKILDSIKINGYNSSLGALPVYENQLLNGAHRVAASILYNKHVIVREASEVEGQLDCSSSMFRSKGLPGKYSDAIAEEYVRLAKNSLFITLFPSASYDKDKTLKAFSLIQSCCDIVYSKSLSWKNNAGLNLIRQIYLGEEWGLTWKEKFQGFARKAELCFTTRAPIYTLLIQPKQSVDIVALKEEIRKIYKIGKHSCHINDTHEETIRLSRIYYNKNSMHHVNNSIENYYPSFEKRINAYNAYIRTNGLDTENYCITSSSILSIYGIHDSQDLDYFHFDENQINGAEINSHNNEIVNYRDTVDEILFNPSKHFWYNNTKIASYDTVLKMKKFRNEIKDVHHSKLLETLS